MVHNCELPPQSVLHIVPEGDEDQLGLEFSSKPAILATSPKISWRTGSDCSKSGTTMVMSPAKAAQAFIADIARAAARWADMEDSKSETEVDQILEEDVRE